MFKMRSWGNQVKILVIKNSWLLKSSKWRTGACLLLPVLAYLFAHSIAYNKTFTQDLSKNSEIGQFTPVKCQPWRDNCDPLILFSPNDAYHTAIMRTWIQDQNLSFLRDTVGFSDHATLLHEIQYRSNAWIFERSQVVAIAFTTFFNSTDPRKPSLRDLFSQTNQTYYTMFNLDRPNGELEWDASKRKRKLIWNSESIGLKHTLDLAILRTRCDMTQKPMPRIAIQWEPWPTFIENMRYRRQDDKVTREDSIWENRPNLSSPAIQIFCSGLIPLFQLIRGLVSNESRFFFVFLGSLLT
jgi:hypothetical protein